MTRKRVNIRRRSGKIGFMGKGMRVPERRKSEIVDSLSAHLDDEALALADADLDAYRDDAMAIPSILRRIYSRRPDAAARPDSGELVADILDKCLEEKTPATPRAGGTAGLGGSVPVRGGVVVDLGSLKRVTDIDRGQGTVTVEAGCTWRALEDQLKMEGLGLRAYPSSAALSTVGGWLSTGGLGVGTLACGGFGGQIKSMEVAVPSGILIEAGEGDGRYSIRSFAGTEGQAGIVTGATFPVRGLPEKRCSYILHLKRLEDGCGLLEFFSGMERPPHLVKMVDKDLAAVLARRWNLGERNAAFIIVAGQGDAGRVEELEEAVKAEAARAGVEMESLGEKSGPWDAYFSHLDPDAAKSITLAGEAIVGTDRLAPFIELIKPLAERKNLMCEYTLVDRGRVMARACMPGGGSRRMQRDVPTTAKVVFFAAALGGQPYGLGIWNSPYCRLVLGEYYRDFRVIKRETDRTGILNPGKFFRITTNHGIPVPGWLFSIGLRLAGGT
ncbi:FAD-binding oxidoreductase [Candidatus Eisenbacteria bacterium]|uniref:D-lactate dehydrogenase (cytochrome) n=1 Tax=Eiseniibacteriota bacterium TaxID=2212470 RepID=A0ABV6YQC3_UNCEI